MKLWGKLLAGASAVVLLGTMGVTPLTGAALSETARYYLGDITGDNLVDVRDIILVQKQLLGLPVEIEVDRVDLADIDRNDVVDIYDLALLKRIVLGMDEAEYIAGPEPEPAFIESTVKQFGEGMPNLGDCRMLSVFVEFADKKFSSEKLSPEALSDRLYGGSGSNQPYDSISGWYSRASYGNLNITGDAVYYTCSGNMADYMVRDQGTPLYETFAMEVLQGLDAQINFADYDADNDGVIDCLTLAVPLDNASQEEEEFWWGCTATWYENPYFQLDGKRISRYIIMDRSPYESKMSEYISIVVHEMGHCIGLPDYYIYADYYSGESHWDSREGFLGDAGLERMDDCIGDFCSFSKLMLGWIQEGRDFWYTGENFTGKGTQTFTLDSISESGSFLILPIAAEQGNYTSEYFIVEYVTATGNNADLPDYCWVQNSGVRVFHVDAELYTDQWNRTNFKYENYSPYYEGPEKRCILRLVNEGETYQDPSRSFYQPGDVCKFGTENFAGYDASGYPTVNTGYTITVNSFSQEGCSVTVTRE